VTLSPGTRLGPYEVTAQIGAGGMGEVYRGRDTNLGRDVAIKILPSEFANDADRLMRFEREARLLASLNDPHIAHVYGLEAHGPSRALVMELVDGADLKERLAHGALPPDEAIPIARQIADALAAAHEMGIVHRDLKPGNIKVRDDGTVKVLDFGLAKGMAGRAGGDARLTDQSPTITSPAMTASGVILGTAAYMSPEQARGKNIDRRTDVWAFGCVLYEMLTGRQAFRGAEIADTVAAILKQDPDWSALPTQTPANVRRLLGRCLAKDRALRLSDMHDARLELDERAQETAAGSRPVAVPVLPWAIAALLLLAVAGLSLQSWRTLSTAAPIETRLDVATPPTGDPAQFALSSDARRIVYGGVASGKSLLFVRDFGAAADSPLSGTENAIFPFWSPDGRSLGFFAEGKLKRLEIGSGAITPIADAPGGRGGSWRADGTILFAPKPIGPIVRVSSQGGAVTPVTLPDGGVAYEFPEWLPDGRHFIFARQPPKLPGATLCLGDLDTGTFVDLGGGASHVNVLRGDVLLFQRDGVLLMQHLDINSAKLVGAPTVVVSGLADDVVRYGAFSAAGTTLAYRTNTDAAAQLTWFSRGGQVLGSLGSPAQRLFPILSADDRFVAYERVEQNNLDAWIMDTSSGVERRVTVEPFIDGRPVWADGGKAVVYGSIESPKPGIWRKSVTSNTPAELLVPDADRALPENSSADGGLILYRRQTAETRWDLWLLPLNPKGAPVAIATTDANETHGQISPDGKWVAYASDESGELETYLQRIGSPGSRQQVSTRGGTMPRWRPDGRELYFVTPAGVLTAVPITLAGATLTMGAQMPLFTPPIPPLFVNEVRARNWYEVSRDNRFLMLVDVGTPKPISVVLNWKTP
jgi:Tol biopolymer transport system component